jgi:hypothetical protein
MDKSPAESRSQATCRRTFTLSWHRERRVRRKIDARQSRKQKLGISPAKARPQRSEMTDEIIDENFYLSL